MKVESGMEISNGVNYLAELYDYLSQIVLTKSNALIEKEHSIYENSKRELVSLNEESKFVSDNLKEKAKEFNRIRLLDRILDQISTLRREGVLVGKNKIHINRLLGSIADRNFHELRNIEENLSAYIPSTV